jgi:hypothetical protein
LAVAERRAGRKEVSGELKMCDGSRPKVLIRKFFFSSEETVV